MAADRGGKGKRTFVCLSSSSDEEAAAEIEEDDEYEEIDEEEGSDSSSSGDQSDCSDHDDREKEDDGDCDGGYDVGDDHDSIYNRVVCLLEDESDLEVLNLKECKAYLQKHGLGYQGQRLCVYRELRSIGGRLKDGNGEALYPIQSFVLNCRGDVCKGDVVLFSQKVYQKFNKVTRQGMLLGKRTVAGRVVKESYGAAKQQHTFTVEVLWSKGIKSLPPLFPLLVKGRNLYRLKTYRQRWDDEAERVKVLSEKHKRGAEARHKRAMKKTNMRHSSNQGAKRQKHNHHAIPTEKREAIETRKNKHFGRQRRDVPHYHQRSRQLNFKKVPSSVATEFSGRSQRLKHHNISDRPTRQRYFSCPRPPYKSQMSFHDSKGLFCFSNHDLASGSTMGLLPFRSSADPLPTSRYDGYNRNQTHLLCPNHYRDFGRDSHLSHQAKVSWRQDGK